MQSNSTKLDCLDYISTIAGKQQVPWCLNKQDWYLCGDSIVFAKYRA